MLISADFLKVFLCSDFQKFLKHFTASLVPRSLLCFKLFTQFFTHLYVSNVECVLGQHLLKHSTNPPKDYNRLGGKTYTFVETEEQQSKNACATSPYLN